MLEAMQAEAPLVERVEASVVPESISEEEETPKTVEQLIREKAAHYGVDANTALRVARCESGLNPLAKNPNSSASGVFQFIHSTWLSVNRMRGINYDVWDAEQNIDNAMWLAKNEGWHHWECY